MNPENQKPKRTIRQRVGRGIAVVGISAMGLGGLGAIGEANVEPTAMVDDVLTPGEMHINPNPTEQEELVRNIALGLFVGGVALTAAGVAIQRPARRPEERL